MCGWLSPKRGLEGVSLVFLLGDDWKVFTKFNLGRFGRCVPGCLQIKVSDVYARLSPVE